MDVQANGDALDAPLESKEMVINLGPSHPAMHGTVRMVVRLDGENIVDADTEIGFLHRGFETEELQNLFQNGFGFSRHSSVVWIVADNLVRSTTSFSSVAQPAPVLPPVQKALFW